MHNRPIRRAAVLIPIFAPPPHCVLFVVRAAHLRDHPGQVAFPGGSVDPADGDDRSRTALRELDEEVGIPADRVRVIAQMPEVRPITGRFEIAPYVGIVTPQTKLTIDPAETSAVFEVPLAAIVAPDAVHEGIEHIGERRHETWHFDYDGMHVWGATGRMLRDFVRAYHTRDSELRVGLDRNGISTNGAT